MQTDANRCKFARRLHGLEVLDAAEIAQIDSNFPVARIIVWDQGGETRRMWLITTWAIPRIDF